MKTKKSSKKSGLNSGLFKKIQNNGKKIAFVAVYALIGGYLLYNTQAATGNDLIVTEIMMEPASPAAGQEVTFSATVKNQGTTATPEGDVVSVAFEIDGELFSWNRSYSSSIAPGDSVTLTADDGTSGNTWTATSGPHTVTATADDNNVISNESNEGNNSRNLIFTIGNTGQLYMSPVAESVFVEDIFTLEARLEPGTTVDGVEASITFDSNKLQFMDLDTSNSPFDVKLSESISTGKIELARGNLSGGVSSDALLAQVTFRARVGSGTGSVSITGNASSSGVYTNPETQNSTISFKTPDTTSPTVNITSPKEGEELFAQHNISVSASDNVGVTKVELYIDDSLTATLNSAPFGYNLDTEKLASGAHTVRAEAYDAAGNVGTSSTVNFTVDNKPEDINQDGVVNLLDFSLLASKYGQTGSNLGREDINQDDAVNLLDFSLLASKFGQ